jgi:hypothetical protein
MIDFRILALGAMALLMAVYGASTASGTSLARKSVVAMHAPYIDGFDLRH